jgi:fermentation-respiration switch protein FrsA (DUF1100 family)
MTETLLTVGKLVLAGYLAFAGLAYFMQDRMLFLSQPLAADELAAIAARYPRAQEVRLPGDSGVVLHGWFLKAAEHAAARAPLLIYFGGNAEEVSWLLGEAPRFAGWSLLLMNYRGYGGSGGQPGEAALYADALRAYDYALARADVEPARIVLMGRSLGAAVAVHVAARRSARAVLLVSPFDSMTELARRHYRFLPVSWLLRHRFESLADASGIDAPLLALVAARDTIIPVPHSRRLFEAWRGPKTWRQIEAADHNDLSDTPEYWRAIGEFLAAARPP